MSGVDIVLSKETANDETALIVAIYVAGGSRVEENQPLFDAESSKVTQEIRAPTAGVLVHDLTIGQEVYFGVPLGHIAPIENVPAGPVQTAAAPALAEDASRKVGSSPAASAQPDIMPLRAASADLASQNNRQSAALALPASASVPDGPAAPRFSQAAALLIAEYGLSPTAFASPFVTAAAVRARRERPRNVNRSPSPAAALGDAVNPRKLAEIEALTEGAGRTMLSVVGTSLGCLTIRRSATSFLEGRIIDLVIFEASRLMKQYPRLNAAYREGRLLLHPAVHAGLAIDGGGRLVVYGIENADRTSLSDLPEIISDAAARYLDDKLTAAEVTRATFTITDLSDGHLEFVLPLLPRGQSCILAIARDAAGEFRLFAGFDHRATEGREVSSFLSELRTRLLSFSSAEDTSRCLYCERSAAEVVSISGDKGLLRIVDRGGNAALCCASCWDDW